MTEHIWREPGLHAMAGQSALQLVAAVAKAPVSNDKADAAGKISQLATTEDAALLASGNRYTRLYAAMTMHRIAPTKSIATIVGEINVQMRDPNETSSWRYTDFSAHWAEILGEAQGPLDPSPNCANPNFRPKQAASLGC